MKNVPMIIILLMALIPLAPPWFIEGGAFDALEIRHGKVCHGKYLDNMTFTVSYLISAIVTLFLPFITKFKMNDFYSFISILLSMWFFCSFLFEAFNFNMTYLETLNLQSKYTFDNFVKAFIFGVVIFIGFKQWETKRL